MVLRSQKFANSQRLQTAVNNSPPLRKGEQGDAVSRLQTALVDCGFAMPISMMNGIADGIYGEETVKTVGRFQMREALSSDGIAGHDTLSRLDMLLTFQEQPTEVLPVVHRGDFAVTTARKAHPRSL